jgi:heme/copper-type cytochrome/quinol oxidase subunit 2
MQSVVPRKLFAMFQGSLESSDTVFSMSDHHDLMFFITFIFFFVLVVLVRTIYYFQEDSTYSGLNKNVVHGTAIEII